jgi:hypothetical protein
MTRLVRRRVGGDESGAILIVVALVLTVLLMVAGMVVDLGGVRTYRANNQLVADSAATAGALTAATSGNGQDVCESAKAYVVSNVASITSLAGIDCSIFPPSCTAATPEVVVSDTVEGFTITIGYPVTDASGFMASKLAGAPAQPVSSADGLACERVGVGVRSEWPATLSKLAGFDSFEADMHTVAKSSLPTADAVPINLLVLDRSGCQTLHASGNGGIVVGAIYVPDIDGDPSNGNQPGLQQGIAASDSDASDGCDPGDGVIDIDGSTALLRADGPQGCTNETGTHTVQGLTAGEGCGKVQTVAPGTPGCNFPACTTGGGAPPNPEPTRLPGILTRAPVDYKYNCRTSYGTLQAGLEWATSPLTVSNGQDIDGCPDAGSEPGQPFINELIRYVGQSGTPTGFQKWTDTYPSCTIEGPQGTIIEVPEGNWHINCSPLVVKRTVAFQGGNIIFDAGVNVESTGILAINAKSVTPNSPAAYSPVNSQAWVFLRSGQFTKAGQASVVMLNTTAYVSEQVSTFALSGGTGTLIWVSPSQGDFDDLALWSDSPTPHNWAGQANLTLEGVFFTPLATVIYAGTAGQNQTNAQFISNRLHARGQGTLTVSPSYGRAIEFPVAPESTLIR